jgi:predicted nuclease of predicted toxin-antitoxin system
VQQRFGIEARHLDELGFRLTSDRVIYGAAKADGDVVIVTKDVDYRHLATRIGPPPPVIWVTCGNTSNAAFRNLFAARLTDALRLISDGEPLVEIH